MMRSAGIRRPTDSGAAFHFVFVTRNIVTRLEFGKIRGGIRRLTDSSTMQYSKFLFF
jgi:hypothetical protein